MVQKRRTMTWGGRTSGGAPCQRALERSSSGLAYGSGRSHRSDLPRRAQLHGQAQVTAVDDGTGDLGLSHTFRMSGAATARHPAPRTAATIPPGWITACSVAQCIRDNADSQTTG
jgi:hypothetical protein